ncbi:hypothetical protein HIM_08963 [Hirsutella minnesotensis 3608]|uniref:Uncharacterized protein n=1 Tax=Hirsutella minnesotensis 3608 TaxID=1043627 RepID=A0A0F7ZGX5_9HYPO|nr:hypothetical protein HIM_08963 [Hirsutella minnesotensis 3608]
MPEGRESPPPERQTGAQVDNLASGQGVDSAHGKDKKMESEVDNLSSNPNGPMDESLKEKFAKKEGNCKSRPVRY